MSELPEAARRVANAAAAADLEIEIRQMPTSTRTAEEAAAAVGCEVAQIVKSLVFRGRTSGQAYLLLVAGNNRVDEARAAAAIGEPIERPDARFVREVTGFAIGGIPPLGHRQPLTTWLDRDLLRHDRVWAAAGTPDCVFASAPATLARAIGAAEIAVT
jgi:prolyl-tRNA editing enzyme YbaK/EbsC (Cys-tRNA(Pro) deacylase)